MFNFFQKSTFLILLASSTQTFAQDSIQPDNSWHFKVEPNMMLPHMKGKASVSRLPNVHVSQSPSDFFEHLKFAGMLTFEAENKDWVITSDIIYASLAANVKKDPLVLDGKLAAKQFSFEAGLLRKITPWLEAGISMNLVNIKSGFDVNLINPISLKPMHLDRNLSKTWVDPMLVARTRNLPNKKFLYNVSGEIGGFGIGSKLAWQLEGLAGYQFSNLFYAMVGYQIISMDYEKGSNNSNFVYDMDMFGPMIKVGFNIK